jgi:hypothetical protein
MTRARPVQCRNPTKRPSTQRRTRNRSTGPHMSSTVRSHCSCTGLDTFCGHRHSCHSLCFAARTSLPLPPVSLPCRQRPLAPPCLPHPTPTLHTPPHRSQMPVVHRKRMTAELLAARKQFGFLDVAPPDGTALTWGVPEDGRMCGGEREIE